MREKNIEQKLVKAVKSAGGIAPKLTCPGYDGMPDRLVLMPEGRIGPLQVRRHEMLRNLGFKVYILNDPEQIGGIVHEIRTT